MANARYVAVNALVKVNKEGAYSNLTFDKQLQGEDLNNKDKALAATLFYGVLDRKITIDYVIKQFSKTPLKKISPLTLEALRIGIYQLMFLERIPESAAVNESVNIIKKSKEGRNSGFVNAVLRNVIRNHVKLPEGKTSKELSIKYSCPEWIINSFISDYGIENTVKLLESGLEAPPVNLRVNTTKITAEELLDILTNDGITATASEFPDCIEISGGIDVKSCDAFKNGYFHVQDIASQITASKLSLKFSIRLL